MGLFFKGLAMRRGRHSENGRIKIYEFNDFELINFENLTRLYIL